MGSSGSGLVEELMFNFRAVPAANLVLMVVEENANDFPTWQLALLAALCRGKNDRARLSCGNSVPRVSKHREEHGDIRHLSGSLQQALSEVPPPCACACAHCARPKLKLIIR